jgi:hypothetical protein
MKLTEAEKQAIAETIDDDIEASPDVRLLEATGWQRRDDEDGELWQDPQHLNCYSTARIAAGRQLERMGWAGGHGPVQWHRNHGIAPSFAWACERALEDPEDLGKTQPGPATDELLRRLPAGWGLMVTHNPDEPGQYTAVLTPPVRTSLTIEMGDDIVAALRAVLMTLEGE